MIYAYINGKLAYPVANNSIKITLQNPFIKDGDEKTMEVTFDMAIPENRMVFGALNRLDTSFVCDDFEDCRLVADNMEVIRGVGTVTSISESEVKLQILSGKSYLRYKAEFDNIYIDSLDYGEVLERHKPLAAGKYVNTKKLDFVSEISRQGFIGDPGRYVFMHAHDEGADVWVNAPAYIYGLDEELKAIGILRAAIQPNLMMVLRTVMHKLGYTIKSNAFDTEPWNLLYVASTRVSISIARALPHWSCYKFLDEFRKLFNASFLFDEANKQVSIVHFDEVGSAGSETIEPLEEFTCSYDEEGLEYLGSSNIEYELSDCEREVDVVSEDVKNAFETVEYADINELYRDFDRMTAKQKMTTLMHCPAGWFYGKCNMDDNGKILGYILKECGWLSPLIRKEGAAIVSLGIVPVAMAWTECRVYQCVDFRSSFTSLLFFRDGVMPNMGLRFECLVANANCKNQTDADWFGSGAPSEGEYVTVEDVLEYGESAPAKESDDSTMEVFFVTGSTFTFNGELEFIERYGHELDMPTPSNVRIPVAFTEFRHQLQVRVPGYSMSLQPSDTLQTIGNFHNQGLKIRRNVNGNNEVVVKFLFDGKPDPGKIYICRGKRFICSRIEMAINANGIDPMKTGYFYEILS